MSGASLSLADRFGTSTRWRTVALQFSATAFLSLALGSLYGYWVALIPALFLALALLGEALFVTLGLIAVLSYAYLGEGYGLAMDGSAQQFGAGFQIAFFVRFELGVRAFRVAELRLLFFVGHDDGLRFGFLLVLLGPYAR